MIDCYFTETPNVCLYKKNWFNQIIKGIRNNNDFRIVSNISDAKFIFLIADNYRKIYNDINIHVP